MVKRIDKVFLTYSSVAFLTEVYAFKKYLLGESLDKIFLAVLMTGIVFQFIFIVKLLRFTKFDEKILNISQIALSDNTYLPVFLGYLFLALQATNENDFWIYFFVIFIVLLLSGNEYFNPIFLLLGFHMYSVIEPNGTRIIVIIKTSSNAIIRNAEDVVDLKISRINNTTYIGRKE